MTDFRIVPRIGIYLSENSSIKNSQRLYHLLFNICFLWYLQNRSELNESNKELIPIADHSYKYPC